MTPDPGFDAQIRTALLAVPGPDDADTRDALRTVLARTGRPARRRSGPLVIAAAAAAIAAVVVVPVVVQDDPRPPPSVQPTDPARPALVGAWRRTVGPGEEVSGSWRMELREDGVMVLAAPASSSVQTDGISYEATAGDVRFDAFVNDLCAELPAGAYRWSVSEAGLRLTVVDETCAARALVFEGTWTSATGS